MRLPLHSVKIAIAAAMVLLGGNLPAFAQGPHGEIHACEAHFGYVGTPTCFGYYSTCWRPWPAECCPCPSFAERLPPLEPEYVPAPAPDMRLESLPLEVPADVPPLPPAEGASKRSVVPPITLKNPGAAKPVKAVGYRR